MKKNILHTMLFAFIALAVTSCSKDSEGLSKIIEYPEISIQGDLFYVSPIGEEFVDPGCIAYYNGQDYSSNIVVTGADKIDINTAGLYTVTYSATSPDGYTWSEKRSVAVCDPSITTDLSGTWTVNGATSYRHRAAGDEAIGGAYKVKITQLAPGIFKVSDFFGGWYDQRAGYGTRYACVGNIQLTADNEIIGLSSSVAGWGDSLDDFYNGAYDPDKDALTWECDYAQSMTFHIEMNK